jgi:hypothetical protein
LLANWPLVAVGIAGILVGFYTLKDLQKQTKNTGIAAEAAKISAEAASLNAQAIINAERPWLFIEIKTSEGNIVRPGDIPAHCAFSVSFRNYGKTPAEIVGFDQHPDCRDSTDDLPWPPQYALEGRVLVHTRMVPAGETWRDPGESHFYVESFVLEDMWRDIQRSKKRLVYWGRLQYRDLIEQPKTIHELTKLGTIHETCFCYFWSPALNEFLICGPLGYNKHT